MGHRVGVVHRVGADPVQVDRLGAQRSAPVQLGQQEEVLHQAAHPGRLLFDALERLLPAGLVGEAAPAEQLGVAPDRGQGCPQLVGGVGHELAQAFLGGRLLGEGPFDLGQHLVEGRTQAAHLGGGVAFGDTAGQVPRGDGIGRARHLAQGPQTPAHHHEDQHPHGQQDGQAGGELHPAQGGQRVVGRVERKGGDQGPLGDRDGDRAVTAVGVPGAPQHHGVGVGAERAGVAADAHPAVDVGHLLHRDVLGQDGRRIGFGHRPRRAGEDQVPGVVQQLHVHVGGNAAREVGLVDRETTFGGVGEVLEAEGLVLGQRVVGLAVEEGMDLGVGHEVGDQEADHEQRRHDGDESLLEAHPSRGRRRV